MAWNVTENKRRSLRGKLPSLYMTRKQKLNIPVAMLLVIFHELIVSCVPSVGLAIPYESN
jgi:hypothetical protein